MSSLKNRTMQNIATVLGNIQKNKLEDISRGVIPIGTESRPIDSLYVRQVLDSDRTKVKQRISEIKSILTNSINKDAFVKSRISFSNSKLAVTSNTYRMIETTLNGLSNGPQKQKILGFFQKANMKNRKDLIKAAYNRMKNSNSYHNLSFLNKLEKQAILPIRYLERSLQGLIANAKGNKVSYADILKLRNKNRERIEKIKKYRANHYDIFNSVLTSVVTSNLRRAYINTLVKESNNSMLRESLKSKLGKSYMDNNVTLVKAAIDIYKSLDVKPMINGKVSTKNVNNLISSFVENK